MIKILILHGIKNTENINTQHPKPTKKVSINPISNHLRIIIVNILYLLGLFVGMIIYIPFYFMGKK
jgi:hypothetical protein